MKNSDAQLIQRTLDGDDAAFAELVEKYQKQVHALVWRKIGDFHFAEEIAQDTFIKAHQQLRTLKKPQRFVSWLYVIASNLCGTWLRNKNVRTQLQEHIDKSVDERATYSEYIVKENNQITVETQRHVVSKLLAKLGESERTVMTLHYFGEMSCSEIGDFLGVSANTVKSRLRRAQQRLKREEPIIREALDNYQISPNLTENIMRETSRTKPATPSGSKPLVPWAVAASTLVVVLLILGFGNSIYLTRFQQPYSLDAQTDMTVELIDALVVANLEPEPDVRTQIERTNAQNQINNSEQQPNDASTAIAEAQTDEIVKDYTKWELPKSAKVRLGKGGINVLQFSPDGNHLAVGSDIGVWLYDVKTGKEVTMFPGMCQSLVFSPDGRFLANGGGKFGTSDRLPRKELQLWQIATGQEVPLTEAFPPASVLRFSEDGKTLISLSKPREIISKLDIKTGRKIDLDIGKRIDFDNPEAYALSSDKLAIGSMGGKIDLLDINTGKELSSFGELAFRGLSVFVLAFSPDGTHLADGNEYKTVRLWNLSSSKEPIILRKHTGWVNVLAFSPDGQMLASGSTDKTVLLWDTTTGELLTTLLGHIKGIAALTFSPDSKTLVSGSTDGTIHFWNTATGNLLPTRIIGHADWTRDVTFLNNNTTLASATFGGIVTLWDLKTSQRTDLPIKKYQDMLIESAAFSPDGTQLVSTIVKGDKVFDVDLRGIVGLSYTQLISLTDVRTGQELATLTARGAPYKFVFSPHGKTVAFNTHGNIRVWNTETGSCLNIPLSDNWQLDQNGYMINPPNVNLIGNLSDLPPLPNISALTFSPDGKEIVSGTVKGKVQLWDAETGVALTSFTKENPKPEMIKALSFTSNGALLAVGSNKRIRIMGNQKMTGIKDINEGAETLVFSPDDTVLVSGLINGAIELWDVESGDKLTALDGHSEPIETLVFSPDGKTLVSTGHDGTILLWDWDEILKDSDQ